MGLGRKYCESPRSAQLKDTINDIPIPGEIQRFLI
jgi:hypothetical protein